MGRSLVWAGTAAFLAQLGPAAADAQPPSATPAAQPARPGWLVDESGLTCAMARPVDPRVTLMVRTYPGSGSYDILLVSPNWRWGLRRTSQRARLALLPGDTNFDRRIYVTNLAEGRGEALNFASGADFLQRFGQTTAIKLTVDQREIGTFDVPQAAAVARVFADCEANKLIEWGADPAAVGPGTTAPRPIGERRAWTSELASAAMDGSRRDRVFALARLNVNREGRAERCALIDSNRIPQVDAEICNVLMQRANFEPARDRNGNAIGSLFIYEIDDRRFTRTEPSTPVR